VNELTYVQARQGLPNLLDVRVVPSPVDDLHHCSPACTPQDDRNSASRLAGRTRQDRRSGANEWLDRQAAQGRMAHPVRRAGHGLATLADGPSPGRAQHARLAGVARAGARAVADRGVGESRRRDHPGREARHGADGHQEEVDHQYREVWETMNAAARHRMQGVTRGPAARAASILILAVLAAGCDRSPRFVGESHDSTSVVTADSFSVAVDGVRAAWEAPDQRADGSAARATARIVLSDLRMRQQPPIDRRARQLLDSLALGAEIAGNSELAIVNLFSTSDPDGGSWPYLFWRSDDEVDVQAVEGSGMRLIDASMRPGSGSATPPQSAALFSRAAGGGQQPLVFVWRRVGTAKPWSLFQTLGPDSLGGVGTARFVSPGADSAVLETRTWARTPGFEECPSCPHLYRSRRFRWDENGLSTVSNELEETPYVAFVRLVQALAAKDRDLAMERVVNAETIDAAEQLGLGEKRGAWRVAPGTEEPGADMTFLRGTREAYRVHFTRDRGRWVVASLEPTNRALE
jgi:hypothetical protein